MRPPIIVTGSQRSGTTIGSVILSKDLNLQHINESDFDIHKSYDNSVIQCPNALQNFVFLHHRYPQAVFVIMRRNPEDILASMKRIEWMKDAVHDWEQFLVDHIVDCLDRIEQLKEYLPDQTSEMFYDALEEHPLFVETRDHFTSLQWKEGDPIGPKYWRTPDGK